MNTHKTSKTPPQYVCPDCHGTLATQPLEYTCCTCGAKWLVRHGTAVFARSELHWSVFPPEVARNVTDLAERKGWQASIDVHKDTIGEYTLSYISSQARADWRFLLPAGPACQVLDIGSGWGNIALSMAKWNGRVYCGDVSMENLRLLNTRLRDENAGNVHTFLYDPNRFLSLPLADETMDVVILNGVLEWMGNAKIDARPHEVQLMALREVRRVLKPGGALHLGIENRYSVATLMGRRLHGELPFVGLLPRLMSNWITRLIRGEPHRTYVYSLRGYRRLLRQAGFEDVDYYWPYPSYHDPSYLIPLHPGWAKRKWLSDLFVSRSAKFVWARRLRLGWLPLHWLAYSYTMRCWK